MLTDRVAFLLKCYSVTQPWYALAGEITRPDTPVSVINDMMLNRRQGNAVKYTFPSIIV